MKRKLVQQGSSTLMVSLPTTWTKEHKLYKGSSVELEQTKEGMLVKGSSKTSKKIRLDVTRYDPLTNRMLITAYIKGYEEIELHSSDSKGIRSVKRHVIDELLGLEIIHQTKNSMILQDITTGATEDLDKLIKRIFSLLDAMAEELAKNNKSKDDLELVIDIDSGINKFVHFCLRTLNKKGYKESQKTSAMYGILEGIEQIGDKYKEIAKLIQKGNKISKKQLLTLTNLRLNIAAFSEVLFSFEKEQVVSFAKTYEKIKAEIKNKDFFDAIITQINETSIRMNNNLLLTVV